MTYFKKHYFLLKIQVQITRLVLKAVRTKGRHYLWLRENCSYLEFSGPHFPAFGLNMERYSVSLRIQSEFGKIRTSKTPNMDTFHEVYVKVLLSWRRHENFGSFCAFSKEWKANWKFSWILGKISGDFFMF